MLTESEKDWLKRRRMAPTPFCGWCMMFTYCCDPWFHCPIKSTDWQDAAEFEARVVAKMAKAYADYVKNRICIDFELGMRCPGFQTCAMKRPHPPCDFAVLKGVRLQVEEEMDAD